tara:strand:+ start:4292 stop:7549 length:3258 start_codon:yes stop_codon:yes gene_type:complete
MALVSSTIPNLINGVSQQPPEIRLPSQCEVQENGISSVVNGLEKRPGTEHVKKLDVASISGAFIHTIQRDEDESYTLVVGADSSNNEFMKIYDRSGNSMPIKTGSKSVAISSLVVSSNVVTVTTESNHGLNTGDSITISGATDSDFNATHTNVTKTNATVYTFALTKSDTTESNSPATQLRYTDVTSSDLSYFDALTNHSENIVATTVADNTFIINRQKTVAEATSSANTSGEGSSNVTSPSGSDDLDTASGYLYEGLIYVKQGDYSSKYVVSIKNTEIGSAVSDVDINTITIPDNTVTSPVATFATASAHGLLAGDLVTISGCTETKYNGTFTIQTKDSDTQFKIQSTTFNSAQDESASTPAIINKTQLANNTVYKVAYQSPSNTPAQNQEYIGTSKIADILTNGETASGTNAWGVFEYASDDVGGPDNTKLGFGGRLPTDAEDEDGNTDSRYKVSLDNIHQISNKDYKFTRSGSVIHVQSKVKFQVEVEDSHGNRDIFSFTPDFENDGIPEATKFTDLPAANSPDDFVIRIIGDNTRQQDDYYVKFNADGSNWKESVKPGLNIHFDMTTMPHRLVRIFDDANIVSGTNPLGITFIYEPIQEATISKNVGGVSTEFTRQGWRSRKVGDNTTNPFPTFLGNTINDIFFHRNRLGFLSDENVIFSEAGNYYNFFATTALTSIDSNPIDVAVSNNQVSILRHAVPFNEALLLFSELQQFKVTAGDALTPTSVSIDVSTQFESSSRAKPTPAGKYVFFPFKRGSFSGIREYFIDFTNEVNDATEVTAHVPQYIPGDVTKLASSSNEDMLVCLSSDETKNMYVYKYYWQGNEKLMSSWSVWKFDADILDCEFLGSKLYILFERTDGVYLETLNLSTDTSVGVMEDKTPVLLDRRVKLSQATASQDTIAEIPYYSSSSPHLPSNIVYVTDNARKIAEADVNAYVAADASNVVYAGIPFTFKYEFSKFTYKQNEVPIQTAKLQLRNLNLLYNDSGYFVFNVDLAPYNLLVNAGSNQTQTITPRKQYQKIFNGFITNVSSVDKYTLLSGTFKGSIFSNASNCKVSLTNDEYLPCAFQSAEWEGFLHLRSQRV